MTSTYNGKRLTIRIDGASHSDCIRVSIDGIPVGSTFKYSDLSELLAARRPSSKIGSTARHEQDTPIFEKGISRSQDTMTVTGSIVCKVENKDINKRDYELFKEIPRPSHVDLPAMIKYGSDVDLSGGGAFSGRMTVAVVIAGGIAASMLKKENIFTGAHLLSVGNYGVKIKDKNAIEPRILDILNSANDKESDSSCILQELEYKLENKNFPCIMDAAGKAMLDEITEAANTGDSIGSVIEAWCRGVPAGLGGALFDRLDCKLAALLFAIPSVKAVDIGKGVDLSKSTGSCTNDVYEITTSKDGITYNGLKIRSKTNNSGGIIGGLSTGMPIILRAFCKPAPSISKTQTTLNVNTGKPSELKCRGRHDSFIGRRAIPVVKSVISLAILDEMLAK